MSSLGTIPTTMITTDGQRVKITFKRLGGGDFKPLCYTHAALQSAWAPVEIHHPGRIVDRKEDIEDLDSLHQDRRFLVRSIAMGWPFAKIALTDIQARINLETRFDVYLHHTWPGDTIVPLRRRPQALGGEPVGPKRTFCIDSMENLFRVYGLLEERKEHQWIAALERLTKIPSTGFAEVPLYLPGGSAWNGDDNITLQMSMGTLYSCRNTEKRGQVIQPTKTASSPLYINYCQKLGRCPVSQIVNIIVANYEKLADRKQSKWTYEVKQGVTCYITYDYIRNKLLSQASKGEIEGEGGDNAATAHSSQLLAEARYLDPLQRVKLHFLIKSNFPQWFITNRVVEILPASLGGFGIPEFLDVQYVWESLSDNHRKLIYAAMGEDPMNAYKATMVLARGRRTVHDITDKDVEARTAFGRAAVETWNQAIKQSLKARVRGEVITIFSYTEAWEYSKTNLSLKTQKDISGSRSSSTITHSSIESHGEAEKYSKHIKGTMLSLFYPLDQFGLEHKSSKMLLDAVSGKVGDKLQPTPVRDHKRALRRIAQSKWASKLPEPPGPHPPGRNAWEWTHWFQRGREAKAYILRTDYERIKPTRNMSFSVIPGLFLGVTPEISVKSVPNFGRSRKQKYLIDGKPPRASIEPSDTEDHLSLEHAVIERLSQIGQGPLPAVPEIDEEFDSDNEYHEPEPPDQRRDEGKG